MFYIFPGRCILRKRWPFWATLFHPVSIYVKMYLYVNPTRFPERMFLPKLEVKWKLHQEGDAGSNQRHQPGLVIPGARQDERLSVPKPILTNPNLMYVCADTMFLQCSGNR